MQFEQTPHAMIDRVASLLEALVGQRPMTLADIARRSHLPRSSAHRILQRLVELGWVERHGFEYVLGIRMFEFGSQVMRQRSVNDIAMTVMTGLHRRTGLTAHLSLLSGGEVLHLDRVGAWPNPGRQWAVGARQPVELTAAGHALLAAMDPRQWPDLPFACAPTCYSVRTRRQLERELDKVRDRSGVAVDSQGCELGVTVVAAALDVDVDRGRVAVSLCGPTRMIDTDAVVNQVRRAAFDIRRLAVGAPRTSRRPVRA
ncbi:putative transcriptional regulator [Nocardia nova SH22a]|uniref:Putative transcriptional regulator n=1 Tax=Nocardia nova SH22a TaxID=1415166 RepID=W5TJ36_9NOCA|nr:IclR family transcriptional regulator [Nocardia nova]AHH19252.1 putative transcriptional regulator [Nocardia nova SH22a]